MKTYISVLLCVVTVIAGTIVGGCTVARYVTTVITGPGSIDAVYEPFDLTSIILVDDPDELLPSLDLNGLLAGRMGDELVEAGVISRFVPPVMVDSLRAKQSDFASWAIDRVGRELGAEQVIYVLIRDYGLRENQELYRPRISVSIKIIDVGSGSRVFPKFDEGGYLVNHKLFYKNMAGAGAETEVVLSRKLVESLAGKLAKLFYKHKPPQAGSGLGD